MRDLRPPCLLVGGSFLILQLPLARFVTNALEPLSEMSVNKELFAVPTVYLFCKNSRVSRIVKSKVVSIFSGGLCIQLPN